MRPRAHRNQQTRMGQLESQTAACVWNEIRYLDSPTDYREYLPYMASSAPLQGSEFVLLDAPEYGWATLRKLTLIIVLVGMIVLSLLRI